MRRRVVTNLVVFAAIAGIFAWWAARNIISVDLIERPYRVTADFENAMGVLPNAEVTYLGTQVGLVQSIRRIPGGVRVSLRLQHGKRIPLDARASISRKSALGEQYIDFGLPPGSTGGGPYLRNGDHVPMSRTSIPIEFSELLRAASALVESIDPAALRTVTHELAVALQGRTDDLRSLIRQGTQLSEVFASRTRTLDRLVTDNTRLTHVLAQHSGSIERSLGDLRDIAQSLENVKGEIDPLLTRGNDLLGRLVPVVRDRRGSLVCILDAVGSVVQVATTDARVRGLVNLLRDVPVATQQLLDATDIEKDAQGREHQWVRVNLIKQSANPAPASNPRPPTPPPVASVPPCAVQFPAPSPAAPGSPGHQGRGRAPLALTGVPGALVVAAGTRLLRGPRVAA